MNQDARRHLIRRKLADGSLLCDRVPRVWSAPGNGESCDACEVAITRQDLLVEGISREEGGHSILLQGRPPTREARFCSAAREGSEHGPYRKSRLIGNDPAPRADCTTHDSFRVCAGAMCFCDRSRYAA